MPRAGHVRARARRADGRAVRCSCASRRARPSPASRSWRCATSSCTTAAGSRPCGGRRSRSGRARSSGIAGVDGNGQSELVEAITGLRKPTAGSIVAEGHEIAGHGARASFEAGIGHIPEDRQRRGLVLDFSLAENLGLRDVRQPPASRLGIPPPARDRRARAAAPERVRRPRRRAAARWRGALSGGNQQKVVIAREMSGTRRILVAAQPTRGLDVGAIEFVHQRLVAVRELGARDPARELRARRDPLAV